MPDRDPTNGELQLQLNYMTTLIEKMGNEMATKEFVNQKFEANNERVARVERDVKEWIQTSTAAHVQLDQESQKRDENLRHELDKRVGALDSQVNGRIDAIEAEQKSQEQALKAQRNGRAQAITVAIVGALLSVIGSIVASGVIRGLFPVS